jgi:hypothetical protein
MGRERLHERALPKVEEIEDCEFPIVQQTLESGYKVIQLPQNVRAIFDSGTHVLRINSLSIAQSLPDFGGESSNTAAYSLLPHKDVPPGDPRRFTILSKLTDGHRDGSTLTMLPEAVATALPSIEEYFAEHRIALGGERTYDERFRLSKEEYDRCFDSPSGLKEAMREMLAGETSAEAQLFARSSLFGYLIRGPHADVVLNELLVNMGGQYISEDWERSGVSIIDNAQVFHARLGGNNPPLKRNLAI